MRSGLYTVHLPNHERVKADGVRCGAHSGRVLLKDRSVRIRGATQHDLHVIILDAGVSENGAHFLANMLGAEIAFKPTTTAGEGGKKALSVFASLADAG